MRCVHRIYSQLGSDTISSVLFCISNSDDMVIWIALRVHDQKTNKPWVPWNGVWIEVIIIIKHYSTLIQAKVLHFQEICQLCEKQLPHWKSQPFFFLFIQLAIYSHCSESMAYAGNIFFWDAHQATLAFLIIPTSRKTKRKKVKTFFLHFLKCWLQCFL